MMDCINRLINFLSWSISLQPLLTINLLILHTASAARSFVVSVRNPLLLENLRVAVRELKHDDPLDVGEVNKTTLACLDPLDYLYFTNIWLLLQFQTRMAF